MFTSLSGNPRTELRSSKFEIRSSKWHWRLFSNFALCTSIFSIRRPVALPVLIGAWSAATTFAQERVSETVHNLSASGPGRIRAQTESQVCIFCHAPHNTSGLRPLWNRELSIASYQIYRSTTMDAHPGQPTGASKLCLSCHDGTIALGSVLSRSEQIRLSGGDFIPAGLANLGTDLSDDHPISFFYTSGLAASDRQLKSPAGLPHEVRLDANGRLQCTSCHDPHHNRYGDFLVARPEFGELCMACHDMDGWNASSHRLSNAAITGSTIDLPFHTVAENACRSCHRPHTAGGHERLLIHEAEEDNCLACHDGTVARANLRSEIDKLSAHDPRRYSGRHDLVETSAGGNPHVECADCHNAHATTPQAPVTTYIPIGATLAGARGMTIGGATIDEAKHEYEVCLRCHGDVPVPISRRVLRQAQTENLRLKFTPGNPSYHPVVVASPSDETPSLAPDVPRGSLVRCTDCHNNDTGKRAGGSGPDGPHGSNFEFLLERNYSVIDDTSESEYEYAMCYKCHQRSSILADQSFSAHRIHIVDARTPCSACHDPHGVSTTQTTGSDHTHLINFDTTIVRPDTFTRRIEFRDLGRFAGSCNLICHGEQHIHKAYGQ
jgi:predicted CXXCH cytochrome family protein